MIPALLALAPTLIVPVLKAVEGVFGAKTGPTKLAAAMEAILPVLEKAATAGRLPGIPDATTLQTVVEAVFQQQRPAIESGAQAKPSLLPIPAGAVVTITYPKE
jgi:hypothetical protein